MVLVRHNHCWATHEPSATLFSSFVVTDTGHGGFKNASVCAESSSILLDNNKIIIERIEGIDHHRCKYPSGHVFMHGQRTALVSKRPTDYLDKGIFLGGNGSYNYFHWMIEILPKVQWLQDLDEEYQAFPLLVSEDVNHISSFREALDLLVKDHPLVMLKKNKTYCVDRLVYINAPNNLPFNLRRKEKTKVSDAYIRPVSIKYLRERLIGNPNNDVRCYKNRVFFARRANQRNYNQDEVFAVFEKKWFRKVFMEDLSLREQIDLMSNAEMIAGPTGAAWTNLIFCSEGTKCLCWMAEEFKEFSGYSNLAHIVGADLRYITFRAGTQSTRDLYKLDYHIDKRKIEDALSSLLSEIS